MTQSAAREVEESPMVSLQECTGAMGRDVSSLNMHDSLKALSQTRGTSAVAGQLHLSLRGCAQTHS
jgi:hypothetical protein